MLSVNTPIKKYPSNKKLIIIVGSTAVGKTALSIELAQKYNCPIISFDSRQFFKELNIGTAKPDEDELASAEHFFINSHSINQNYTSGKFEIDANKKLEEIFKEKDICIAVGGSGLYIDALVFGIDAMPSDIKIRNEWIALYEKEGLEPLQNYLLEKDPAVFDFIDKNNRARMIRAIEVIETSGEKFTSFRKNQKKNRNYEPIWIGLDMEREKLFERINLRVDEMIEKGLEKEVKDLMVYKDHTALKTVGYSEFFDYFDGKTDLDKCIELIKRNSRRYAKRQMTWFKKNKDINWFKAEDKTEILNHLDTKI